MRADILGMIKGNRHQQKGIDYKWVIVALCFLMVFTVLGFCNAPKSLFISAITEALGIKRSLFSINDSCRYIATAVTNIFFGVLIKRYGAKKLIGAGFLCLILSCVIYSVAPNVFVFCIGGCLLGVGVSFTTTTMVGCVINKWCREKKGTIMGLVLAANGLGGALAIQIVSPMIYQEENAFGYKNAYRLIALILLTVGAVILLFFRNEPKEKIATKTPTREKSDQRAQRSTSTKSYNSSLQGWSGISYSEAVKKPYFYGIIICVFLSGMCLEGVYGIAAAHMIDVGLDATYVVWVLSFNALTMAAFKFLTGIIYDKFGLRLTMSICSATGVIVMFALACATDSEIGKGFALIYGIFSSLAFPLESVLLPICTGDLFGLKSFDQILGILAAVNVAGYAVGAPAVNVCFDLWGSYQPALLVSGVLMLVVTIVLQFVLCAAKRQRKGSAVIF